MNRIPVCSPPSVLGFSHFEEGVGDSHQPAVAPTLSAAPEVSSGSDASGTHPAAPAGHQDEVQSALRARKVRGALSRQLEAAKLSQLAEDLGNTHLDSPQQARLERKSGLSIQSTEAQLQTGEVHSPPARRPSLKRGASDSVAGEKAAGSTADSKRPRLDANLEADERGAADAHLLGTSAPAVLMRF